jgi:hypothetical protein
MLNIEITKWREYSHTVMIQETNDTDKTIGTIHCNAKSPVFSVHKRKIIKKNDTSKLTICAFIVEYLTNPENAISDNYQ